MRIPSTSSVIGRATTSSLSLSSWIIRADSDAWADAGAATRSKSVAADSAIRAFRVLFMVLEVLDLSVKYVLTSRAGRAPIADGGAATRHRPLRRILIRPVFGRGNRSGSAATKYVESKIHRRRNDRRDHYYAGGIDGG